MVVNADDFGFFNRVSEAIVDAADKGRVTATGVMANGPVVEKWTDPLKKISNLSIGVHLNSTLGRPLTARMGDWLKFNKGLFASKEKMMSAIAFKKLPKSILLNEWREQIIRCKELGLQISFINSHEHIHMFPLLLQSVRRLAMEFGIKFIRSSRWEWGDKLYLNGFCRNALLAACRIISFPLSNCEPILIGISVSGRMNINYCEWRFKRLCSRKKYELMCHPGYNDPEARSYPALQKYHDWESEIATLLSDKFKLLLDRQKIFLATYEQIFKGH